MQAVEGYAKSKEPFLLELHFTAPHWPWEGRDERGKSKRIRNIFDRDGGSQKTYGAMVQSLDADVGRVLRRSTRAVSPAAPLFFAGDNGGRQFSNVWPFSGMKHELLEGGLRIPAIVRWPGRIAPGAVSEQVMITMDWMPTLLAAVGTSPDAAYPPDGEDLGQVLTGRIGAHPEVCAGVTRRDRSVPSATAIGNTCE